MWDVRTYPRQSVLVYLNSNVTGHPILCFFSLLNLATLPGGGQDTPELRTTVRAVTETLFGYFRAGAWFPFSQVAPLHICVAGATGSGSRMA